MASGNHMMKDDEFYEHTAWIRRVALELVREPNVADDLVQETWLAFFVRRPRTDQPLRPWFSRVLRNQAALRRRKSAGRRAREELVASGEALPDSRKLVERAETSRRLVDMVLQLGEPYRSTLLLRFYEDLQPKEIAERRGLPAATVRTHLRRGLEQLRERMDRDHGGDSGAWMAALLPLTLLGRQGARVTATSIAVTALIAVGALIGLSLALAEDPANTSGAIGPGLSTGDAAATASPRQAVANRGNGPRASATSNARRIRLVAQNDGTPLAAYEVEVDGERLRADAQGWIETERSAGQLIARGQRGLHLDVARSHGVRVTEAITGAGAVFALEADSSDVVLATGPCFEIMLDHYPVPIHELEARLVSFGLTEYQDDGRVRQLAALQPPAPGFSQTWVRFWRTPDGAEREEAGWMLEVRSSDGLWAGQTRVTDVAIGATQHIGIELAAVGRLDCWRAPGGDAATVALALIGANGHPYTASLDQNGHARFRWIPAGEYELRLSSPLHEPFTHNIEIAAGERRRIDVPTRPLATSGSISGFVTSESGSYDGQLLVFLHGPDGRVVGIVPTTWKTVRGQRVAKFRFDEVPAGACVIDVVSLADMVSTTLNVAHRNAPLEGLQLILRDTVPASDWNVVVVSADNGEPVPQFTFDLSIDDGPMRSFRYDHSEARPWRLIAGGSVWNRFGGAAVLRGLTDDASFEWLIQSPGFETASGSHSDFESSVDGARALQVTLAPQSKK